MDFLTLACGAAMLSSTAVNGGTQAVGTDQHLRQFTEKEQIQFLESHGYKVGAPDNYGERTWLKGTEKARILLGSPKEARASVLAGAGVYVCGVVRSPIDEDAVGAWFESQPHCHCRMLAQLNGVVSLQAASVSTDSDRDVAEVLDQVQNLWHGLELHFGAKPVPDGFKGLVVDDGARFSTIGIPDIWTLLDACGWKRRPEDMGELGGRLWECGSVDGVDLRITISLPASNTVDLDVCSLTSSMLGFNDLGCKITLARTTVGEFRKIVREFAARAKRLPRR